MSNSLEVISVHIPKTAGTTFRDILIQLYGESGVCIDNQPNYPAISEKTKVIHGHFNITKYEGKYPQAKRIIWLRNPVERLVSQFFFWKSLPLSNNPFNDPFHKAVIEQNLSIVQFAEIPAMRNLMYKATGDKPLSSFYFVGLQEFFAEDVERLSNNLGWSNFKINYQQKNQYPKYQSEVEEILNNPTIIKKLTLLNSLDQILYQTALNLRKV